MKNKFILIAGPCLAESREIVLETAETLVDVCKKLNVDFYFKASYRKANRTSAASFSGVGDEIALRWLAEVRKKFNVPVLTDIHSVQEAAMAGHYVDVLQIPAFLSRQTDIIEAAATTGKIINIKKGQFMAPDDMGKAADKAVRCGAGNVWLTERGHSFGYHDLIVDYRALTQMKTYGYPVIYDATHSVQRPSVGEQSGGNPQYIRSLARGAVAVGVDGLFLETHPDPVNAKSDSATQIPLNKVEEFINMIYNINNFMNDNNYLKS